LRISLFRRCERIGNRYSDNRIHDYQNIDEYLFAAREIDLLIKQIYASEQAVPIVLYFAPIVIFLSRYIAIYLLHAFIANLLQMRITFD